MVIMDSTWLIAGAGVLGTAAWLYSKTTSPESSGDDDTGNSSLSDNKPRWGSRARTGLEYISGSSNLYTTSCGWSPEEKYCPDAVIASCSNDCLRPYLATTYDWFGTRSAEWTGGGTQLTDEDVACFCSPIRPMKDGASIRMRPVMDDKYIKDSRFTFDIEVQGMVRQSGARSCQRNLGSNYRWDAIPSGIKSGLAFTAIAISPTANDGFDAVLEWREGEYRYDGITFDSSWNSGDKTIYRFSVTTDAFADLSRGWCELNVVLQMDRDYGNTGENWLETCEFTEEITMTIPHFVFTESSTGCESGCPEWKIDNWNIATRQGSQIIKKFLPDDAPRRIVDTWNDPEKASKYDTYAGTTAQTEPTVLNAETIFPRNGYAVF